MRRTISAAAVILGVVTIGCGGAVTAARPEAARPPVGPVGPVARAGFEKALSLMARHDRDNDWTEAACKETASLFLEAAGSDKAAPSYDAALAYQRCKLDVEAKARFREALAKEPGHAGARTALALYAAEEGPQALDGAIAELSSLVVASRFSHVDAMAGLAMLELRRGNRVADSEGADDFERAKRNLHRALAVDDGYLPALNQLAIYHLERARRGAGASGRAMNATHAGALKKADAQALELAALVCSQAIRKNARYAPIHNTAGLVQVELGNLSGAVAEFDRARKLDPSLFEAHANYGAVNLAYRGFAEAEHAYRAALALRPRDYDSRIGLALALRGQIDDANEARLVPEVQKELAAAKQLAPDRPEAYYNEAILTQEYGARAGGPAAEAALLRAKALLGTFLAKAGSDPTLADARKRAAERMEDIEKFRIFVAGGAGGADAPPPAGD